jgi:hypothetical protein
MIEYTKLAVEKADSKEQVERTGAEAYEAPQLFAAGTTIELVQGFLTGRYSEPRGFYRRD